MGANRSSIGPSNAQLWPLAKISGTPSSPVWVEAAAPQSHSFHGMEFRWQKHSDPWWLVCHAVELLIRWSARVWKCRGGSIPNMNCSVCRYFHSIPCICMWLHLRCITVNNDLAQCRIFTARIAIHDRFQHNIHTIPNRAFVMLAVRAE